MYMEAGVIWWAISPIMGKNKCKSSVIHLLNVRKMSYIFTDMHDIYIYYIYIWGLGGNIDTILPIFGIKTTHILAGIYTCMV